MPSRRRSVAVAIAITLGSAPLQAQAWSYPAMQIPTTSTRDYLGALVSASGTSVLAQWREGINAEMHVGVDAGIADFGSGRSSLGLFAAGNVGRQLVRARSDVPVDLLLTGGIGLALGDGFRTLRIPVGISAGRRFDLDGGMALTPFLHPRASLDFSSVSLGGGRRASDNTVSLDFDIGVDWELNKNVSFRAAGLFTGSDFSTSDNGFAIGLVWRPNGLAKMR
jgi:opacity protein-like surface antigen